MVKTAIFTIWFCCASPMTAQAHQADQPVTSNASSLAVVRKILQTPEAEIDLARAKVTIDHLIDPTIDIASTLTQLDTMAEGVRARLPMNASSRLTLDALRFHIYEPNPWNGNRPFRYDLDDPLGTKVRNKILSNYMATHRGNCISMPLLFIILGQKLGIDVTASNAPNHLFVKYRDADGKIYNLETTSGAGFTRDEWMQQQFPMTKQSIASGIYMRPLSKRETIVAMLETLLQSYTEQGKNDQTIELAKLMLKFDPKDVTAILFEHQANLKIFEQEFVNRYPKLIDIPIDKRTRFIELEDRIKALFDQAYALGWRPLDQTSEKKYQEIVRQARSVQ